jgi:hypothetical protein
VAKKTVRLATSKSPISSLLKTKIADWWIAESWRNFDWLVFYLKMSKASYYINVLRGVTGKFDDDGKTWNKEEMLVGFRAQCWDLIKSRSIIEYDEDMVNATWVGSRDKLKFADIEGLMGLCVPLRIKRDGEYKTEGFFIDTKLIGVLTAKDYRAHARQVNRARLDKNKEAIEDLIETLHSMLSQLTVRDLIDKEYPRMLLDLKEGDPEYSSEEVMGEILRDLIRVDIGGMKPGTKRPPVNLQREYLDMLGELEEKYTDLLSRG